MESMGYRRPLQSRGRRRNGRRNRVFNIPGTGFVDILGAMFFNMFARFVRGAGFVDILGAMFFNMFAGFVDIQGALFNRFARFVRGTGFFDIQGARVFNRFRNSVHRFIQFRGGIK
jgi:hypothetical protein